MLNSSRELLLSRRPDWFSLQETLPDRLVGLAVLKGWAWPDGLELTIITETTPKVRETLPGTSLPLRCSERHIQFDQTFCLGYPAPKVSSDRDARTWWSALEWYLRCQSTAEQTRLWPAHHALDHGYEAGTYHAKALALATRLGLEEDYDRAHAGLSSWLTGFGLRRFGWKKRGRAVPMATKTHRPRPHFRRRNQQALLELMILERKRSKALAAFWRAAGTDGRNCCGTMAGCPLAAKGSPKG